MDFNFSFSFDYNSLKKGELDSIATDDSEIKSVFENGNSKLYITTQHEYMLGYSDKKRIVGIYFDTKTKNHDLRITKVGLPDEKKIKDFYCCCEEGRSR